MKRKIEPSDIVDIFVGLFIHGTHDALITSLNVTTHKDRVLPRRVPACFTDGVRTYARKVLLLCSFVRYIILCATASWKHARMCWIGYFLHLSIFKNGTLSTQTSGGVLRSYSTMPRYGGKCRRSGHRNTKNPGE